jgi:uncharacterized protein
MRPSIALESKRHAVREAAGRFRAANPRLFGSVLRGTDSEDSDLDLLVDALPGATWELCKSSWRRCWACGWTC